MKTEQMKSTPTASHLPSDGGRGSGVGGWGARTRNRGSSGVHQGDPASRKPRPCL